MSWISKVRELLSRDISLSKNKEKSLEITMDELISFAQIRQGGLSLEDCITLCFKNHEAILEQLEEGRSLPDLLTQSKKKQFAQLKSLLKVLSLDDALTAMQSLQEHSRKLEEDLLKQAAYPLFLMAFSYGMLWFFTLSILPAMSVYGDDGTGRILNILLVFFTVIWIGIGLFLIGYLLVFYTRIPLPGLKKLVFSVGLVQKIHTIQFSMLWNMLFESGLSTRQCLEAIEEMSSVPFCARLARSWKEDMEKGMSLLECARHSSGLDPEFLLFFQTGIDGGHVKNLLDAYQKRCSLTLKKSVKRISLYIQLFSYGCVGALVISVYQVMFVPLNMLETM